jgi:hypothetical protein
LVAIAPPSDVFHPPEDRPQQPILVPVYFTWTFWSWASARTGVARISIFMYLVPMVSGLASWWFLAERYGFLKPAGTLVILRGLALIRLMGAADAGAEASTAVVRPEGAPERMGVRGTRRRAHSSMVIVAFSASSG